MVGSALPHRPSATRRRKDAVCLLGSCGSATRTPHTSGDRHAFIMKNNARSIRLWNTWSCNVTARPLSTTQVQRPAAMLAAWLNAPDLPAGASKVRGTARHTHATHALAHGAELSTVRDKLRHVSIAPPRSTCRST